jgi:hypothetical protein
MPRWPAGLHLHASAQAARTGKAASRILVNPQEDYDRIVTALLSQNQAQTTIGGGGSGTVRLGPTGLGTRWYLTQANVQTTTGPNDTSTVALYLGAQVQANLLGGTSYAGGQDTIGLHVRPLTPGDLITAVWTGGHAGDLATLTLYGDQDVLTS